MEYMSFGQFFNAFSAREKSIYFVVKFTAEGVKICPKGTVSIFNL